MNSKWSELIEGTDTRELWVWQKMNAAGVWQTFYRGKSFGLAPDRSKVQMPDDPFFETLEEGLVWLRGDDACEEAA